MGRIVLAPVEAILLRVITVFLALRRGYLVPRPAPCENYWDNKDRGNNMLYNFHHYTFNNSTQRTSDTAIR